MSIPLASPLDGHCFEIPFFEKISLFFISSSANSLIILVPLADLLPIIFLPSKAFSNL